MREWVRGHEELLWWLGVASLVAFVGTLLLVPVLVRRMPADYFVRERPPRHGRHPVLRIVLRVLKNLLAAILLAAGFAMLFLPGQGVLTMLLGLSLLDFPGKRRLEIRLVAMPRVYRVIRWIRRRGGRPPLELPGGAESVHRQGARR